MSLAAFVQAMPKVELHVHLEGTVQPATLFDLAQRHDIALPVSSPAQLPDWYRYTDFNHFIEIFVAVCNCLRTPDDFARVVYEYGRTMAEQNIWYAEVTFTPYTHAGPDAARQRITWPDLLTALNTGRARAAREWGVHMCWIPDIVRSAPATAATVVEWVTSPEALSGGVVALGLGGPEEGYPPEPFAGAFRAAAASGLHSNPHAGETVGPASVWGALRALKAERIGHGVRSVEDAALLAYLAEHQVPLEVNPTSNLCLGVAPSYADHPLRQLVEAGVCVTINSDDPAMFNTTLNAEYLHAVQDCGLTVDQLETAALNAVQASYLPPDEKTRLHTAFRTTYARLRAQHDITA